MEKATCKKCGKVIEGYTKYHVEFLMKQHNFSCNKKKEATKNETKATNNE